MPLTFNTASVLFKVDTPGPPLTTYSTNEAEATKFFGTSTTMWAMQGNIVTTGNALTGFLNLVGTLQVGANQTMEVGPGTQEYNWSSLNNGGIMLTYNQFAADFAGVIQNGGTITGTGGFTELAVPVASIGAWASA